MALQTFTAGQVLTAAQVTALQTNGFNQSVSTKTASYTLVAADKGTRVEMNSATATTITVDTDLFNAGDTLFIQNRGAGVCTITAGTATVSSAGSLALAQNAGGTLFFVSAGVAIFYATGVTAGAASSALTLISTTTIGTAVASVTVSGAFSATFENYLIKIVGFNTSANATLRIKINGSTGTTYQSAGYRIAYATATLVAHAPALNANGWDVSECNTADNNSCDVEVFRPFLISMTSATAHAQSDNFNTSFHSRDTNAASSTAFTVAPASGTMTGGVIYVYGYGV